MADIKLKRKAAAKSDKPKRTVWQEVRSFALLIGAVLLVRTFIFQPFTIPSGSMEPNLVEGDYIIVSKFTTGFGEHAAWPLPFPVSDRVMKRGPDRGDVVVFRPEGLSKNFIKRVIGLPGDTVEVRDHLLYVNGDPVPTTGEFEDRTERLGDKTYAVQHTNPQARNTKPRDGTFSVPPGYYFVLGDNRDNSFDSRVEVDPSRPDSSGAGLVPSNGIVGEAEFVLLSVRDDFSLFKPWTWYRLRGDRFFKGIT